MLCACMPCSWCLAPPAAVQVVLSCPAYSRVMMPYDDACACRCTCTANARCSGGTRDTTLHCARSRRLAFLPRRQACTAFTATCTARRSFYCPGEACCRPLSCTAPPGVQHVQTRWRMAEQCTAPASPCFLASAWQALVQAGVCDMRQGLDLL